MSAWETILQPFVDALDSEAESEHFRVKYSLRQHLHYLLPESRQGIQGVSVVIRKSVGC
jgi:hypothetical protein